MGGRMSQIGYNMGEESLRLFQMQETHNYGKINEHNDENEQLIVKIEDIHKLLSAINTHRNKAKDKVDFHDYHDLRDLVDKVRSYDENLMEPYTYSWEGKEEINGLAENLNNYIKTITPRSSQMLMLIQQLFYEINQIFDVTAEIGKTERDSLRRIIERTKA
jgi:hypothetical protein